MNILNKIWEKYRTMNLQVWVELADCTPCRKAKYRYAYWFKN